MLNHSDLVRDGAIEAGPAHCARAGHSITKFFRRYLGIQVTVMQPVMAVGGFNHFHCGVFSSRLRKGAGDIVEKIQFFRHDMR